MHVFIEVNALSSFLFQSMFLFNGLSFFFFSFFDGLKLGPVPPFPPPPSMKEFRLGPNVFFCASPEEKNTPSSSVGRFSGNQCVFTRSLKMSVWARWFSLCATVCVFLLSGPVWTFELTLLHTNDNHARIEETSGDSGKCSAGGPCFAGVARRFTKVSEIRKKEKNVLFLDAGDQFQGTIWFNYYKGAEAAHFMNKLGYDAMVKYYLNMFYM